MYLVTGVQTCALPIFLGAADAHTAAAAEEPRQKGVDLEQLLFGEHHHPPAPPGDNDEIGRASCRERV